MGTLEKSQLKELLMTGEKDLVSCIIILPAPLLFGRGVNEVNVLGFTFVSIYFPYYKRKYSK